MPNPDGTETEEERAARLAAEAELARRMGVADAEGWATWLNEHMLDGPQPVAAYDAAQMARMALEDKQRAALALQSPLGEDDPLVQQLAYAGAERAMPTPTAVPEHPTLGEQASLSYNRRIIRPDGRPLAPSDPEYQRIAELANPPLDVLKDNVLLYQAEQARQFGGEMAGAASQLAKQRADYLRGLVTQEAAEEMAATGRKLEDVPDTEHTPTWAQWTGLGTAADVAYQYMPYGMWPSMDRRWAVEQAKREAGTKAGLTDAAMLEGVSKGTAAVSVPPKEYEGYTLESELGSTLRQVGTTIEAALVETVERIPMAPVARPDRGGSPGVRPLVVPPPPERPPEEWARLAEQGPLKAAVDAAVGANASPALRAAQAKEIDTAARAARSYWTVGDVLLGVSPGELQRVDRSEETFGADWLQGILERVERGEGLGPDLALSAERRLGPEWSNHGYAAGLALDVLIPFETMALAPVGAAGRAVKAGKTARELGVPAGEAARISGQAFWNPEFDMGEQVFRASTGRMDAEGPAGLHPAVRLQAENIARTEFERSFDDIAAEDGFRVAEPIEARADLDAAQQAEQAAKASLGDQKVSRLEQEAADLEARAVEDDALAADLAEAKAIRARMATEARTSEVEAGAAQRAAGREATGAERDIARTTATEQRVTDALDASVARAEGTVAERQGRVGTAEERVAEAERTTEAARAQQGQAGELVDQASADVASAQEAAATARAEVTAAPRPGKARAKLNRPKDERPEPPIAKQATAQQVWDATIEANSKRSAGAAPKGYKLGQGFVHRHLLGGESELPTDAAYIVRDATGAQVGEARSLNDALTAIGKRRQDGDTVFREGSEREVARWNRSGLEENKVVADYHNSSAMEYAMVKARVNRDPALKPASLKLARRGRLTEEQAEALAQVAREREAAAASAEAAVQAAIEDQQAAEALFVEAQATVDRLKLAESRARGTLTNTRKNLERARAEAAAAQADAEALAGAAHTSAEMERAAAEQRWMTAQAEVERLTLEVQTLAGETEAARRALGDAGTQEFAARNLAAGARSRSQALAKATMRLRQEARAATAAAGARAVVAQEMRVAAGRRVFGTVTGAPQNIQGAAATTEQILRRASSLVARNAMPETRLRMLPTGSFVPRRTYDGIMADADRLMGVESMGPRDLRRYTGPRDLLTEAFDRAPVRPDGTRDLRAGARSLAGQAVEGTGPVPLGRTWTPEQYQRVEALIGLAERAEVDPARLRDMTAGTYNDLRRQAIREVGGTWADARYSTRATQSLVNQTLSALRRPVGTQPKRAAVEVFRRWARDFWSPLPESMRPDFTIKPGEGLTTQGKHVLEAVQRRLEMVPDEVVRRWQQSEGATPAERMRIVLGSYDVPHPETVDMALSQLTLDATRPYPERVASALAARERLQELWPAHRPRPEWLTTDDDALYTLGFERWTREIQQDAAALGRQWVVTAIEVTGNDVPNARILAQTIDDGRAARIYQEVYSYGYMYGPESVQAMRDLVPAARPSLFQRVDQLISGGPQRRAPAAFPEPGTNQHDALLYANLLKLAGQREVEEAIRQLLQEGVALPVTPLPSGSTRVTAERAIAHVLNETALAPGPDGVIRPVVPEGMLAYANHVLDQWGVAPGAGTGAYADVQVPGRGRVMVPTPVAKILQEATQRAVRPLVGRAANQAISYRTPLNVWKRAAIGNLLPVPFTPLMRPQFFTNTFVGNYPMLIATRGLPGTIADSLTLLAHPVLTGRLLMRHHFGMELGPDWSRAVLMTPAGPVTPEDLYRGAVQARVFDSMAMAEANAALRSMFAETTTSGHWTRRVSQQLRMRGRQLVDFLPQLASAIDQTQRMGTYLNLVRRGEPIPEAGRVAANALPNYHNLTEFEKGWMRTLVPFYAFLRKSGDAYTYALLTDPSRVLGQVRLGLASQREKFNDEIERGGLSDDQLSRMIVWSSREMYDDYGRLNPWYGQLNLQTGPVGIADFFAQMGMLMDPGAVTEPGTPESKRALGLLNPWVETFAIMAMDRKLRGTFTERDLQVPREILTLPVLGDQARAIFCVGPRPFRGDPRLADPDATAAMNGEPSVWAAGSSCAIDVDQNRAAIRTWMYFQTWMGQQIARTHNLGQLYDFSPAPAELTWDQRLMGEALGLTWSRTYSESAVLERHWQQQEQAAKEAAAQIQTPE